MLLRERRSTVDSITRIAKYSEDEKYRYSLEIRWALGIPINFLLLNPSTATELANDPTVARCQTRAKMWGYGAVIITNIFAWRDTDPAAMKKAAEPIGVDNDFAIWEAWRVSDKTVCGWGGHGKHLGRDKYVREHLFGDHPNLWCLKQSADCQPWHPLYLPYSLEPIHFI